VFKDKHVAILKAAGFSPFYKNKTAMDLELMKRRNKIFRLFRSKKNTFNMNVC